MDNYISHLDTERFRFKVAKVNQWDANPAALIHALEENGVKLIISRLPSEDIVTINKLENMGFQLKDIQLTYFQKIEDVTFDTLNIPSNFIIRDAEEADLPSIRFIAKQSFANYGHYFANSRIDKFKANEIYEDWASRSFYDKNVADKIFVLSSKTNNDLAGFLTFKILKKGNKTYAAGGIGAVSSAFRNQGVFQLLVKKGLLWGKEMNLDWEEHNALTTNYAVGKVFSSTGFKTSSSSVTLHAWLY